MKYLRFILYVFCAFCLNAFYVAYADSVLVLNATGKPPVNTPDKSGFIDQLGIEAFRRIGFQIDIVSLPAERALRNVNDGYEDGEMSRIKGLDRLYPNLIRVPEKVMDWEFVAFSHNNISLDNGWDSLKKYSVAIINGWKILEFKVPPEAELIKVRSAEQLFTLLKKRRVEFVLYEKWAGLQQIRAMPGYKINLPALEKKEMFIYLNKKHQNLIKPLTRAMQKMKQDGTYKLIHKRTLGELR